MTRQSPDHSGERTRRPSDQLDSWKEIAAHFKRDVRTVRRWEATQALPVRRHQHKTRGSVYAYASELDRWWDNGNGPRLRKAGAKGPRTRVASAVGALGLAIIVAAFSIGRTPGGRRPEPTASGTTNLTEARALYQRGRHLLDRRGGWRKFIPLLEQSVAKDPSFAPAQAALAKGYFHVATFNPARRRTAWEQASAAARQALALDPALPAAHTALGMIYLHRDWNWVLAEQELRRAIQLDPRDAQAHVGLANYFRMAGRSGDAIAARRRACDLEPLKVEHLAGLGLEFVFARMYRQGAEAFRDALDLEPGYMPALNGLDDALQRLGLPAEEEISTRRVLALRSPRPLIEAYESVVRRQGYPVARKWLEQQELEAARRQPIPDLWTLAYSYARVGETERAWRYLEAAVDQRDPAALLMRIDPDLDPLRSDSRFDRLVQRLGEPSRR